MAQAVGNVESEIREYFQRYSAIVYRRALVLLGSTADAEDAVQEVFVRAANNMDEFRGESQVSTWLYRITTNYCLSQIRNTGRQEELLRQRYENALRFAGAPDPGQAYALRELLALADPEQAHAAVYVHVDGMTRPEAAQALGVSLRTVSNLLNRFGEWARNEFSDISELGFENFAVDHISVPDSSSSGVSTSRKTQDEP